MAKLSVRLEAELVKEVAKLDVLLAKVEEQRALVEYRKTVLDSELAREAKPQF